jgi:copper resistance protein D
VTLAAGLIVFRFIHFSALMVLFGSSLFPLYAARSVKAIAPHLRWPVLIAAFLALISGIFWFAFTAATMSGDLRDVAAFPVLSLVAKGTGFGRLWMVRLLLTLAAVAIFARSPRGRLRWTAGVTIAALLVATSAWAGHGQEGGIVHSLADALHLLSASIWIGALFALLILLARWRHGDAELIARSLSGFSGIGPAVVAVLLLTGIANGLFLIGPENLLTAPSTPYGVVLIAKIVLFAAMLGFAVANRFWLTPRLAAALGSGGIEQAVRSLRISVFWETALAALVLAAVALLGILPPPGSAS